MQRTHSVLAAGLLALLAPAPSQAAGKPVLESGSGCMRVGPGAECKPLAAGAAVGSGGELVAGEEGAVVRFPELTVELRANTVIRLSAAMPLTIGPGAPVKSQVLLLSAGKVRVRVPQGKQKAAMLVRGPGQLGAIVVGEGIVSLAGDAMAVANLGGKLLATSSKAWVDVPVMKIRTLSKTEDKPVYRDMMAAPVIQPSRQVVTSLSDPAARLSLAWSPIAGASSYEVTLRQGDTRLARATLKGGEASHTFGKLGPGRYEASVQSFDADGLDGGVSAGVGLAVVNVEVPPGAFRSGPDAVQLAEGQEVKLSPIDGVEAAFDNADNFAPAPATLGLRGGAGRRLRLRARGGTTEATIRLDARTLAADIELGPKTVRWPRDTISASVRLVNRGGGLVPPDVQMVPSVKLGVTPIEVRWQREGDLLRAQIAPQPLREPSVLRVEVYDQHGIFLGRNFLEIAVENSSK